jgi:hypothetical protein
MKNDKPKFVVSWWWNAPGYFDKWRVFPRIFISMYIWMLYETSVWFMALPDPTNAQAGFVSAVVGAGAAWFGLYVNSGPNQRDGISPIQSARAEIYDHSHQDDAQPSRNDKSELSISASYTPRVIRKRKQDDGAEG